MERYAVSPFEKRANCYLIFGNRNHEHIESVPGYEFELTDTETGESYTLWATKYCGLWNITSPWYGRALFSQNFPTRKSAIEALKTVGAKRYIKFIEDHKIQLYADRDELSNRYYELIKDYEKGRR